MKEKNCCGEGMEETTGKKRMRTEEEKKALITRLNRIEGQIRGISKMVENEYLGTFFLYLYFTNIILALFNLIPITPLDGGRIVYSLGNRQIRDFYDKIESYGIIIVFGLVYILSSTGIFERIMNFFMNILG